MELGTITLKIILEHPVSGVIYGLQSGSGHHYDVLQKQVAQSGELIFEFEVPVKRGKEGNLVLQGPLIQGPTGSRFLYLDIGGYAGQENASVSGRLKVPLPDSPDDITRAAENRASFITRIQGTKAKNGGPMMGTIKPFGGWKLN